MSVHFIYECNSEECILGKNSTSDFDIQGKGDSYRAIRNINYNGVIVIPEFYNRKPIKHIGRYAFYNCNDITDVVIKARIITIGQYGFGNMGSLRSINIPSSVETIGKFGIYSYNSTSAGTSTGVLVVSFEPGSQIKLINNANFGRKEKVIILIKDIIYPNFGNLLFMATTSYDIFSDKNFTFNGKETIVSNNIDIYRDMNYALQIYEKQKRTCRTRKANNIEIKLLMCILLSK